MILGIGADICDIRRIEGALARFGERFLLRVFTPEERALAIRRGEGQKAATLAKRFAAKEACAKALGTGFRHGVFMANLGVVKLPGGQPVMQLAGGALRRLEAMTPPGMKARVLLTMTDEYPYAFAEVMITADPIAAGEEK